MDQSGDSIHVDNQWDYTPESNPPVIWRSHSIPPVAVPDGVVRYVTMFARLAKALTFTPGPSYLPGIIASVGLCMGFR